MLEVAARWAAASVALLSLAGCAAPATDGADPPPLVLVLRSVPDPAGDPFADELRAQRLVPGRDLVLRPADPSGTFADVDAVRRALEELDREPNAIVAYSTPYTELAAERFPDVPVIGIVNDPVAAGLVVDRDRPEGTITGVTYVTPADRTLDLAARLTGDLDRLGYLVPDDDPAVIGPRRRLAAAAEERGTEVVEVTFTSPEDVDRAVAMLVSADVDAVLLGASNAVVAALPELEAELTAAGVPVVANNGHVSFAVAVLEPDGSSVRRQAARQAARLLAGDPVATIPIEDPRRFRITLDRAIAADLGLPELDDALLRQADEVR